MANAYAEDEPKGTIVSLYADEQMDIDEDMLICNLRFEHEADSDKAVQEKINETMKSAKKIAEKYQSVKFSVEQYSVYKRYIQKNNGQQESTWAGTQTIMLKSLDDDQLLKLAGRLQELGLLMSNLNYAVSPEQFEKVTDGLLEKVILKIVAKAERVTKALGKSKYKILNLNVNADRSNPVIALRSLAEGANFYDKSMTAPSASPGQSRVSLGVYANILVLFE